MAKQPNVRGKLPLPQGKVISAIKPSPSERAVLERVGWKEGDPIPTELAKVLAEVKAVSDNASNTPPVPITTKPLVLSTPIAIETLPPDQQAEYRDIISSMLQNAKVSATQADQQKARLQELLIDDAGPGVNEAIMVSEEAAAPDWPVVDDRVPEAERPEAEQIAADPEAAPEEPKFDPVPCPHCGWARGKEDKLTPSDLDVTNFVEAVLGGKPFRKAYTLYGGRLKMSFRTLTTQEIDAIYEQLRKDMVAGIIDNIYAERERRARYFAISMLEQLVLGTNVYSMAPLAKMPLDKQLDMVMSKVLTTEMLVRHVTITAGEFRALADKLEVNATNPDFWKAVDSLS